MGGLLGGGGGAKGILAHPLKLLGWGGELAPLATHLPTPMVSCGKNVCLKHLEAFLLNVRILLISCLNSRFRQRGYLLFGGEYMLFAKKRRANNDIISLLLNRFS